MTKSRLLISVLLLTMAAAAVLFAVALVVTSLNRSSNSDLERQLSELRGLKSELQAQQDSFEEWRNVDQEYARFRETFLIPFTDFSLFRKAYETLLDKNSLRTTRLNYRIKPVLKDTVRVAFEFGVAGQYRNIKRFILDVENHRHMLFLTGAQFDRTDSGANARFTMEVYFAR